MAQVLKESVRCQILRSARELLIKKGYKGCTMREIAEGTNITVGNLYRYFSSKKAIYDEIINTVTDKIDAVIVAKSDGVFSLYRVQTKDLSERELKTCSEIEAGILDLVPFLVKHHKKELLILFHSSNERNVKYGEFDLLETIGQSLDLIFETENIGKYILSGMFYAMEQVLLNEQDIDLAISKICYIVKKMLVESEIK